MCDRVGLFIDTIELPLPTPCIALEWDERGEVLACMQESASELILWYLRDRKREHVELQIKDPSFMKFSPTFRGKDMVRLCLRSRRGFKMSTTDSEWCHVFGYVCA